MRYYLLLLGFMLLGHYIMAQSGGASAQIVAVKAGNNQKDSTFVHVGLSSKAPVRLSYNQNYLIFAFISSKPPITKPFLYKLTGLDYSWITCTGCSQAIYAHLDGGDYTFEVKTTESDAVPATFSFTVEGNVWHKWWFVPMFFLYFLVLAGVGIYFFVLYRFRQKLQQQRLIHNEKMASMVELTAGIAHEIQNPLNFVNNFSEVSVELIEEQKEALANGDTEEAIFIADDLVENLQRITQNGQRASNIVRGMLEHSRSSTTERQLTNLNALCDECLRLAYQGQRRSEERIPGGSDNDNSINCTLETHLAPDLPLISVAAQDMSRVLLNLFNNAFYAVGQKQKTAPTDYLPTVSVSTRLIQQSVEIRVRDNGAGIPEAIKAKIFQPFFTTKPTGEGTGLGLSLSYDIVTKGHGGTLTVESEPGKFSQFTVALPVM